MTNYRKRLETLGISWPELTRPNLPFVPTKLIKDVLYVSGQIPEASGNIAFTGKVGAEVDLDSAFKSAQLCAANIIYWVEQALDGDLDRVEQLAKLTIFINAAPGFSAFSQIGNAASEVMNSVFGVRGQHARSAVGMAGLPANVPVEIEAVFHVR